ncbi:MAG: YkvA family protein [Armatimonadota bacterium]
MTKTSLKQAVQRRHPMNIARFVAHLPSFARLFLGLLRERRVSVGAKLILLGAIAYVISPFDFLPDLMPLVGQVDDLALLTLAAQAFIQLCPLEVVREHVSRIDGSGKWRPFHTE